MKITCESCQAKYSIADEKVAGRVFKIRCKRCGEVIIVKGGEELAQKEVAAQEPDVAVDAVWHVVINGEQFGPYQPAQIGELLATSQIDWEAYVWREGFDNWVPACDVDELVSAISGPQAEQQGAAGQAPVSDFSSVPVLGGAEQPTSIFDKYHASAAVQPGARPSVEPASMGADPFAEDAHGAGGVFDEPSADASADVFGAAAAASPFDGGDNYVSNEGVVASGASPRVSVNAMTGARNENSVLFSLKNLQALATGSSSGSIPPAAMVTPGKAGLASGEGSGLIDIRALASAAGIGQADEQFADRDELLSMGSKTGAFGTLGSPMAPTASIDESGRNKLVFAILGGAAFLSVAMIAVAFIFRGEGPDQPAAAVATVAPSTEAKSPAESASVENKQQEEEEKLSEGELAARAAAAQEKEQTDHGSRTSSSKRKKSRTTSSSSSSSSNKQASATPPEQASEPERPVKKHSTGKESIDDLLAGALSGSAKPKTRKTTTAAESAGPKLPSKPSRDDVLSSLRKVQPAVQDCAKGQSGIAMADIVVANSGRVKNVRVSRVTGPVAGCIARAVRKAKFPKFSSPEFSVSFPFRL